MKLENPWPSPNNCPIRERTADGVPVGRCWFYLRDGTTCPRHGDITDLADRMRRELMDERVK